MANRYQHTNLIRNRAIRAFKSLFVVILCLTVFQTVAYAPPAYYKIGEIWIKAEVWHRITYWSEQYKLDKYWVTSLGLQESKLSMDARGSIGEVGIFQIAPWTAIEIKVELRNMTLNVYKLDDNIQMGVYYLSKMLYSCDGNYIDALAVYNCGLGNRNAWWERAITRTHIKKILEYYDKLK